MTSREVALSDANERMIYASLSGDAVEMEAAREAHRQAKEIPGVPPSDAVLDRIAKNLGMNRADLEKSTERESES